MAPATVVSTNSVSLSSKDLLESGTKALALFISITYVIGLITVNSFMLTFGVRTVTLVSAEYISAGLPLSLLFLLTGFTAVLLGNKNQRAHAKLGIVVVSLLLLGLILLYITDFENYMKTLRTIGIIALILFVTFFATIKRLGHQLAHSRSQLLGWAALYGLIFLALTVALSTWYGRAVYNDILPNVGGGAGSVVSFVTDTESGRVLSALVPMQNENQTEPLQLIRKMDDHYVVLLADGTSISVSTGLVKGVIHHQTRGWEIKQPMLD